MADIIIAALLVEEAAAVAYIVMTCYSCALYSYGLYRYGIYSHDSIMAKEAAAVHAHVYITVDLYAPVFLHVHARVYAHVFTQILALVASSKEQEADAAKRAEEEAARKCALAYDALTIITM